MSDLNRTVWDELDVEGFEDAEKPTGSAPVLPRDITEATDKVLMETMREFVEWGGYAGGRLAHVCVDLLQAEGELATVSATAAFLAKDAKTVAAQKAAVAADPKVREHQQAVLELEAYKIHLTKKHEYFEKGAQFCSRELSRRLARHERENRDAKWGV